MSKAGKFLKLVGTLGWSAAWIVFNILMVFRTGEDAGPDYLDVVALFPVIAAGFTILPNKLGFWWKRPFNFGERVVSLGLVWGLLTVLPLNLAGIIPTWAILSCFGLAVITGFSMLFKGPDLLFSDSKAPTALPGKTDDLQFEPDRLAETYPVLNETSARGIILREATEALREIARGRRKLIAVDPGLAKEVDDILAQATLILTDVLEEPDRMESVRDIVRKFIPSAARLVTNLADIVDQPLALTHERDRAINILDRLEDTFNQGRLLVYDKDTKALDVEMRLLDSELHSGGS